MKVRGVWDGEAEARLIADDIEGWRDLLNLNRSVRRYNSGNPIKLVTDFQTFERILGSLSVYYGNPLPWNPGLY